jgi:hypothetical protein
MRFAIVFAFAAAAFAQGTEPKPEAEDYDVHGQSKNVSLGAEYMVHSFSGQGQTFIANDYLVVEIALYPAKGEALAVKTAGFGLRVNGKTPPLAPQPPTMVAATLQRPEWQNRPHVEGGGGLGNTGVILGRPVPSQVPGGQTPRAPLPPHAPASDPPGGIDRPEPVRAEELVAETALPEGEQRGPVSGFLYFAYKGKTSSIKSLDLLYEDVVLKLR